MSVSHGGFEREYLNGMGVSAHCQQTWKVNYVFVMTRKWGKGQKDFLKKIIPASFPNSLYCYVILWNMSLN